jgi:hypothetical protein
MVVGEARQKQHACLGAFGKNLTSGIDPTAIRQSDIE